MIESFYIKAAKINVVKTNHKVVKDYILREIELITEIKG